MTPTLLIKMLLEMNRLSHEIKQLRLKLHEIEQLRFQAPASGDEFYKKQADITITCLQSAYDDLDRTKQAIGLQ